MEAAVWGLIGTVVGALTSIGTSWLSISSTSKIQEEKVKAERVERANAFQRETLLELQDSVHDHLRLTHRAYIEDCRSQRAGTDWGKAMLGEELSESLGVSSRKMSILIERVANDSVRSEVKALLGIANQAMLATSQAEAEAHLAICTNRAQQVLQSMGSVLREHY